MKTLILLVSSALCLLVFKSEIVAASNNNNNNNGGPSETLIKAGQAMGIDPAIVTELWRTKQPWIITKPDEQGQLCTTTYRVTENQLGISKTITKEPSPAASHLESKPTGASPQQDWEYLPPVSNTQRQLPSFPFPPPPTTNFGFESNFGSNWPDFGASFPSLRPNWPNFSFPPGVVPQVSTKTEKDNQGRTITTTTKFYSGPANPSSVQPGTNLLPSPSWLQPRPAVQPSELPGPAATEPIGPPLPTAPPMRTTTPLPSQDEFVRRQETDDLPSTDDQQMPASNTQTRTRVTSFNTRFNSNAPPKVSDLDPTQQEVLLKAGITDQDIRNTPPGGVIERTRSEPGHVVRTLYRVSSAPAAVPLPTTPKPAGEDKSIDNFLSQVNLTPADILAQNGEVIKTIVDKDGRILSARFVLSTVKQGEQRDQGAPTK